MDNINELNVNSLYDYLVYSLSHLGEYKFVTVVTDKQVVVSTKKRDSDDHWNMITDIAKMIYPNKETAENDLLNDSFVFTSLGNDLEVEIPEKVSEEQLNEVKNILRQIKQFEYEYDTFIFMPSDTYEIVFESNKKLTDNKEEVEESIIGTPINSRTK